LKLNNKILLEIVSIGGTSGVNKRNTAAIHLCSPIFARNLCISLC